LVLIHLICDVDFNLVESIPVNNLQLIYNKVEDNNLQLTRYLQNLACALSLVLDTLKFTT